MYQLSREVRFAIDLSARESRPGVGDEVVGDGVVGRNGFAGKPPVTGIGQVYYALVVTVSGEPDAGSGYLLNIKKVDDAARDAAIPLVTTAVRRVVRQSCVGDGTGHLGGGGLVRDLFAALADRFAPHRLDAVELKLSPLTSLVAARSDPESPPMIRLNHRFEFAASHRLHNPALSDAENRQVFGKCNNVHGHGHNYEVQVTLRGEPDGNGFLMNFEDLERIVDEAVIGPLDHKHLNLEVDEFAEGGLNPSVEHIAAVIYRRLEQPLATDHSALDAVTVWETPKTWCEYRPGA